MSGWSRQVVFFFPKEEFTGISDWEGRPLSLHSDHFLIVYSYLKSSFKILFTSQFSSQPSPSPIPLYFPCLLMPHASLQPRTEWFWNKHSLIGEFPQCSFETSILLWWHVTSFTGQTWLCVYYVSHTATVRLIKMKTIVAMPGRHDLPERAESKGKYMVKNTSFFHGWGTLHCVYALHCLYPRLCQWACMWLSCPTVGNGAADPWEETGAWGQHAHIATCKTRLTRTCWTARDSTHYSVVTLQEENLRKDGDTYIHAYIHRYTHINIYIYIYAHRYTHI